MKCHTEYCAGYVHLSIGIEDYMCKNIQYSDVFHNSCFFPPRAAIINRLTFNYEIKFQLFSLLINRFESFFKMKKAKFSDSSF